MKNDKIENVRYFGLHFNKNGNSVNVINSDSIIDIGDIAALDESLTQSDRYRKSQYGE